MSSVRKMAVGKKSNSYETPVAEIDQFPEISAVTARIATRPRPFGVTPIVVPSSGVNLQFVGEFGDNQDWLIPTISKETTISGIERDGSPRYKLESVVSNDPGM